MLPILIGVGVLQDGVSLAAAFAVLTVIVAEAVLTLPLAEENEGAFQKRKNARQNVIVCSTLAASIVLGFELRLFALPIVALPILVNAAVDDTVALFV